MRLSTFQEHLNFGKVAENIVARYMQEIRGCSVLPIYEVFGQDHKGPRFFTPQGPRVAPDMLVFSDNKITWVEVKRKTTFTWHRKTRHWVTGVDRNHYGDYLKIGRMYPWDVWLLFLHESDTPAPQDIEHSPGKCPIGLFACPISTKINHEHGNWGRHGMVYWKHEDLTLLATIAELHRLQNSES